MKPNTYTKLYAHIVFSPKGRSSLLGDMIREKVRKYIYGIIKEQKCYPLAINGTKDHLHILIGFPPTINISDLVRDIKRSSSLFINQNLNTFVKFAWQEGYGAFTVSYRNLDIVIKYIINQVEHHSKIHFREEYVRLLDDEGVDFNPNYLYEFYND